MLLLVVVSIICSPLLILAMGVLFHSACALANREESFLKSLLFGNVTFYPAFIIGAVLTMFIGSFDRTPDVKFSGFHVAGACLGLLASCVLGSIVYLLAFQGNFLKATQVSLLEMPMRVLLGFLLLGMWMVIAAIGQAASDPEGRHVLLMFILMFLGFLAVVGGIFFLVWLARQRQLR